MRVRYKIKGLHRISMQAFILYYLYFVRLAIYALRISTSSIRPYSLASSARIQ